MLPPLAVDALSVNANSVISLSTAGTGILFLWRMASRVARNELKVETLWDYHIRHAVMQGINNETLRVNSPIQVTQKGREWFQELEPELTSWYNTNKRNQLSDKDLFVALERDFGKRIISEVAVPHNIHAGEAMAIAVALCRSFRVP